MNLKPETVGFVRGGMLFLEPPARWRGHQRDIWKCCQARPRPSLKETKLAPHSDISCAVYWPGEGYGGASWCHSMDEARDKVAELEKLNFGDPKKHPIRIIITTREIIEFTREAS